MNQKEIMDQYINPSLPGSLSGLESFFRVLKKRKVNVTKKQLKVWMMENDTYTLHKPALKKFTRSKVYVAGIDDTWQIDLVDMKAHSRINKGYKYILTCIDVFSTYAWAIPIKSKTAKEVTTAFAAILKTKRKPKNIQADEGTEFFNKNFLKLMTDNSINLYNTKSEYKACVVERFNRTIKEKMLTILYRYSKIHLYKCIERYY